MIDIIIINMELDYSNALRFKYRWNELENKSINDPHKSFHYLQKKEKIITSQQ